MEIRVLILTPLPLEYEAVVKHLAPERETIFKDRAAYEVGRFVGRHHTYTIVLREPGMKNVDMALATEKAIQSFNPQLAFLIGIAGGVKDVNIGDILVAKKVYGYESGKEDSDGFKSRPAVDSFSDDLLARAQALSRRDDWKKRTSDDAPEARVLIGPIAAGDKVVAGVDNPTFQRIKLHYNDTLGLEMEAIGFATALQGHRLIHGLAIRGISDLCEGKSETDKHNWQPVAAERAAAFGFEMLYQMDASGFVEQEPPGRSSQGTPTSPNLSNAHLEEFIDSMYGLIGQARAKEAIPKLRDFIKTNKMVLFPAVLQLSERWEAFERKSLIGILSNSEKNVERAQITSDMLELIGKLREV